MKRLLAALFVLSLGVVFTTAQDRNPFGQSSSAVPFDVFQLDDKTAWRVRGKGSLRVEELVAGTASACGLRVTYSGQATPKLRELVPYVGPDNGVVVVNSEIADFAADLLAAQGLTLVGVSTGKARVVSIHEAASYAIYVSEAELAALPASEWVIVQGAPRNATYRTLKVIAESRERAGMVAPMRVIDDYGYVITTTAGEARTLMRLIRDADQPGSGDRGKLVRVYDLGTAEKAGAAASVLRQLFDESGDSIQQVGQGAVIQTRRESRINAAAVAGTGRVLVRAAMADQALVQTAIDAIK